MPSGTLSAAKRPAGAADVRQTSPATSAAANPAKWKCGTVSARIGRLKPKSSCPERSATSASTGDRRGHQRGEHGDLGGRERAGAGQPARGLRGEGQCAERVARAASTVAAVERGSQRRPLPGPRTAARCRRMGASRTESDQAQPGGHDHQHAEHHDQVDQYGHQHPTPGLNVFNSSRSRLEPYLNVFKSRALRESGRT